MSQRPGILAEIFRSLRKSILILRQKDHFVGEDPFGNKYYEKIADPSKGLKGQRRVESADPDKWNVPELPAEWMAWLQGRRTTPPTQEELMHNLATSMKIKKRAEELEQSRLDEDKILDQEREIQEKITGTRVKFPVYKEYENIPGEVSYKPGPKQPDKKIKS